MGVWIFLGGEIAYELAPLGLPHIPSSLCRSCACAQEVVSKPLCARTAVATKHPTWLRGTRSQHASVRHPAHRATCNHSRFRMVHHHLQVTTQDILSAYLREAHATRAKAAHPSPPPIGVTTHVPRLSLASCEGVARGRQCYIHAPIVSMPTPHTWRLVT